MIECIKGFRAQLKLHVFGHSELTLQSQIQGLPAGTIDRVSPDVSEGEGCRGSKRSGIKPTVGRVGTGAEHGLSRVPRTNWIFAQKRARVGGIAKYRDSERKSALCLIYR